MRSSHNLVVLAVVVAVVTDVEGFQQMHARSKLRVDTTSISLFNNNKKDDNYSEIKETKKKGIFGELKGMLGNFDAVVDDFVYKRMGNGEQFYGKRKYNPSGSVEGDYNGMGQSDLIRIEIARVQKEEIELRRQRRLEAEQEAKGAGPKKWG